MIPYEKGTFNHNPIRASQMRSKQKGFLWDSELCYGRFKLIALRPDSEIIPDQFNVSDSEKILFYSILISIAKNNKRVIRRK